jgi:hypothetical protein
MDSTSFQSQLDFYLTPCGVCNTAALQFAPEILKIFYLARVIFSESSTHKIKTQTAPLFGRREIFSAPATAAEQDTEAHKKSPMDNFIQLGRISSLRDVAHLLPREYIIYPENIFYKKLANRELIKIDYETPNVGITSVDDFLKKKPAALNRSQKIYLLFDNSTSMNGENFKKLFIAKAIALEYLRRVSEEKPQLYFRSFHSEVGQLMKAGTSEEIHTLIQYIAWLQTGGGHITRIGDAVVQAIEDITSDPEFDQAEILVMTDGFGPVPPDLLKRLGGIKLHVLLIPDLDIEKILQLYPNRDAWEEGGGNGTRPMPEFWSYYSKTPPPMVLSGDELYTENMRSYRTAGKSVKELKTLEILQGLHQIYTLQEICGNFIFVVVSSVLEDEFEFSPDDLVWIGAFLQDLQHADIETMTNDEKLQYLQSVNFARQLLTIAKANTRNAEARKKINELMRIAAGLQSRILTDPWIQSVLKVDKLSFDLKFDLAAVSNRNQLKIFKALAYLAQFMWRQLVHAVRELKNQYRI